MGREGCRRPAAQRRSPLCALIVCAHSAAVCVCSALRTRACPSASHAPARFCIVGVRGADGGGWPRVRALLPLSAAQTGKKAARAASTRAEMGDENQGSAALVGAAAEQGAAGHQVGQAHVCGACMNGRAGVEVRQGPCAASISQCFLCSRVLVATTRASCFWRAWRACWRSRRAGRTSSKSLPPKARTAQPEAQGLVGAKMKRAVVQMARRRTARSFSST